MKIDPGDENPAADTVNGVYERRHAIQLGEYVLDLGAHRGYFALKASGLVGQMGMVVAFEPHPVNFARLQERCATLNVRCVNAGAWDEDGEADLWPAIDNSGGHSFFHVGAGQEPTPIRCRLLDIGRWLQEERFRPDFVKIDTELSEARIIRSILRTDQRPEFAAEIHNIHMWNDCLEMLKAKGYHVEPETFTNYYMYAWK